jgi:hypothetical protein
VLHTLLIASGCSTLFGNDLDDYEPRCPGRVGCASGGASGNASTGGSGARDADASTETQHPDVSSESPDADAGAGEAGEAGPDVDLSQPGTLWGDDRSRTSRIPVCFTVGPHGHWPNTEACSQKRALEQDCSGIALTFLDLRQRLIQLLGETWERVSNIDFDGFGDCPVNDNGRLLPAALPHTIAVSFVSTEKTLSHTGVGRRAIFTDVHVNWRDLVREDRESERRVLAEFGRALGFPYHWLRARSEGPISCTPGPEPGADTSVPPPSLYDHASVLNPCHRIDEDTPARLSSGDAIGAAAVYGPKPHGALVGRLGRCAYAPLIDAGSATMAGSCQAKQPYQWFRTDPPTGAYKAQFEGVARCLALDEDRYQDGDRPLLSQTCNSSDLAQRIAWKDVEWRAMGTLCIAANGNLLELQPCNGTRAQRWTFFDSDPNTALAWNQIQSAHSGDCVTSPIAPGALADDLSTGALVFAGEFLVLKPCSSSDDKQQLQFPPRSITIGNYCLNVAFGLPAFGSKLVLWPNCTVDPNAYNARFYLSGAPRIDDSCPTQPSGSEVTAGAIRGRPCEPGNLAQVWDYHF